MAGIVKSTKKRLIVKNRVKEIEVPTGVLDTDLFFSDLTAMGGTNTPSNFTNEMGRLPTVVKNEAVLALTIGSRALGQVRALNGDTKTIEILSFSRDSSGISTFNNGGITLNENDMPRPEYNPTNGQLKGYLFEPASTNLLPDSGLLNGINSFGTRSAFGLSAVDTNWNVGSLLAKGVKMDIASDTVYAYRNYVFTTGVTYVFSFYAKLSDGSAITDDDFLINYQGSVAAISTALVESKGNGLYRIQYSFVARDGANTYVGILKRSSNTTKSVIFSGLQMEENVAATSYIPTSSASATRLIDKLTGIRPISVFPFNSWYMECDLFKGWFGNGVNGLVQLGRNYIKGSKLHVTLSNNNNTVYNLTQGIENGVRWLTGTLKSTGEFRISAYNPLMSWDGLSEDLTGQDFVLSMDVMATAPLTVTLGSSSDFPLTANTWRRISIVCPASSLTGNRMPSFSVMNNPEAPVDTKVYHRNWQVEKGTVATPWTPAPEDIATINANGELEISSTVPVCVRSLSLIARAIKQEEI